jgi:hypothetical protein
VAPPARAPAVVEGATNDVRSAQRADCTLAARDVPGEPGQKRFVECPAGCAERYHAVWGSDLYSDDSSVCAAAIHAGAITAAGGVVLFDFLPGRDGYAPSRRAGIESRSGRRRSFQVRRGCGRRGRRRLRSIAPPRRLRGDRSHAPSAERPTVEHVSGELHTATIPTGEYTDDLPVCARCTPVTTAAGGKIIVRLERSAKAPEVLPATESSRAVGRSRTTLGFGCTLSDERQLRVRSHDAGASRPFAQLVAVPNSSPSRGGGELLGVVSEVGRADHVGEVLRSAAQRVERCGLTRRAAVPRAD